MKNSLQGTRPDIPADNEVIDPEDKRVLVLFLWGIIALIGHMFVPAILLEGREDGPVPADLTCPGNDVSAIRCEYLLGKPMSINRASAATLTLLPGIGPGLAERIIRSREEHGPMSGPADLLKVPGLGPRKVGRLAGRVSFD